MTSGSANYSKPLVNSILLTNVWLLYKPRSLLWKSPHIFQLRDPKRLNMSPSVWIGVFDEKKKHINNISGEIRIAIDQTYLVIIYVRSPFGSLISESHVNYGQLETSHSAVTWEMFNPQSPTCLCNWSIAMWCHVYSMWLRSSWEKDGKVNYEI